ncbi:type II secretion system protein GspM (plasmid) [Marinovum sp. KMM 9989]
MISTWLQSLTGRERALLGFGAALGLLAFAFLVVIEPRRTRLALAQENWAEVTREAAWLDEKALELAALTADVPTAAIEGGQAPRDVAALEAAIMGTGLAKGLTRIAPQSGGRVAFVLADVSYLGLIEWMRANGVAQAVTELVVTATKVPDRVDATITVDLTPAEPTR